MKTSLLVELDNLYKSKKNKLGLPSKRFGDKLGDQLILTLGSTGLIIYTIADTNQVHAYDFRYDGHKDYIPKKLLNKWIQIQSN